MTKYSSTEAGIFFMALMALCLASSPVSFALGAYGEVFYDTILSIWIASLAALFAGFVIGQTREGERYLSVWGILVLLVPSALMFSGWWGKYWSALQTILEWLLLLALPYYAFLLVSVAAPEAAELHDKRLRAYLALGFIALNGISFFIGVHNDWFFTCADFRVAGDELPLNCWRQ